MPCNPNFSPSMSLQAVWPKLSQLSSTQLVQVFDALVSWSYPFPAAMIASFSTRLGTPEASDFSSNIRSPLTALTHRPPLPWPSYLSVVSLSQALDAMKAPEVASLLARLAGLGGTGDPVAMDRIQEALLDKVWGMCERGDLAMRCTPTRQN